MPMAATLISSPSFPKSGLQPLSSFVAEGKSKKIVDLRDVYFKDEKAMAGS